MTCPKCKTHLVCGCKSCKSRLKDVDKLNVLIMHDEQIECPKCGFISSYDYWLDFSSSVKSVE